MAGQRGNWPGPGYPASNPASSPGSNSNFSDMKGGTFQNQRGPAGPQGQQYPYMNSSNNNIPGGYGQQQPQQYQTAGTQSPRQAMPNAWQGHPSQQQGVQHPQARMPQGPGMMSDPSLMVGAGRGPHHQMPAQYNMYGAPGASQSQSQQQMPQSNQAPMQYANPSAFGYDSPDLNTAQMGSQWVSTVPTATSNQPLRGSRDPQAQPQPPQLIQAHAQAHIHPQQPQPVAPHHPTHQHQFQSQPHAGYGIRTDMLQGGSRGMDPYQTHSYAQQNFKKEQLGQGDDEGDDDGDDDGDGINRKGKSQKGASDFVKKLFHMLDDTTYQSIVSWSPSGDSFIVRDMNDFTKHVLPRHFRHSNFASFVRQLNKYDFHKVKKPEEHGQPQQSGVDQQWEFKHPAFLQGREDLLDNVRRKVPATKKGGRKDEGSSRDQSPTMPALQEAAERGAQEYAMLKEQVATLTQSQDQMTSHINNLTKQYQSVIGEMLTFQKNMVQQDQLMQNLIQYLMGLEADRSVEAPQRQHNQNQSLQSGQQQQQPQQTRQTSSSERSVPQINGNSAFVSANDVDKLVTSFTDVAKGSFAQMSQMAQHANGSSNGEGTSTGDSGTERFSIPHTRTTGTSMSTSVDTPLSPKSSHGATPREFAKDRRASDHHPQHSILLHPPHLESDEPSSDLFNAAASAVDNPSLAGFESAGLRVFTVGTLQPREDADASNGAALQDALNSVSGGRSSGSSGSTPFGINVPDLEKLPEKMPKVDLRTSSMATPRRTSNADGQDDVQDPAASSESGANMLRVRRSTYVPGWAVPPKVLVVDDDDVSRKLGSKFLQVFGCAIDVAVDGVSAVNKMNLEKYDLVLMDIVMPNLDGVSATSLIREFDPRTPIISMTSNSDPKEMLSYMKSGMTDMLPKPFTKEGLLGMLEKHLIHLKTVQKMDEIPRALGLPPVSESMMQNVLSATAASAHSVGGPAKATGSEDGANPLAALMGNGPEVMRRSQEASEHRRSTAGGASDEGDPFVDDGINPLANMGFSDEEYISMLQNLIAAGAVSDSAPHNDSADLVANVMGVARGEGSNAGTRSKENTPMGPPRLSNGTSASAGHNAGTKRSAGDHDDFESKKGRFTELAG